MSTPKQLTNFFTFTLTGALQPALRLALLPVFASMLGPAGLGRVAYIEAIIMFVTVFSGLGLPPFFVRNYFHGEKEVLFATLTRFLVSYNLVILALCLGASFLFQDQTQRLSFAIASVTNFLAVLLLLPLRELRIEERAVSYGTTAAGLGIGQALAALLFVWLGFGSTGWFMGYLVAMIPFAIHFGLKALPRLAYGSDKATLRNALGFGVALSLSGLGLMAVGIADRVELKLLASYDDVGIYSVGYALGFGVSVVCAALYTTFEPSLYKHPKMEAEFGTGFSRAFSISYVLVLVLATLVILFIEPLGRLLLEPRFGPAFPVARIVALCAVYSLSYLFFTLVGIRLQSKRTLVLVTAVAAGLNVLANLVLIPLWGIEGAAYSTFGAYFAMIALFGLVLWRVPQLRVLYLSALGIPLAMLGVVSTAPFPGIVSTLTMLVVSVLAIGWMSMVGGLVTWARSATRERWR